MARRTPARNPAARKPTHTVASGLGGVFQVHVEREADGWAHVTVHYPGGDFHGRKMDVPAEKLTPIANAA